MDSQSSNASEVPDEIICYQDEKFVDEITSVNDLYFANQDQVAPLSSDDENTSDHNRSDVDDKNEDNDDYSGDIPVEPRGIDLRETNFVDECRRKTCQCSKLYGSPCSAKVDFSCMLEYRQQCQEMTSDELDLTVKVQLAAHRKSNTYWPQSMSKKQKLKERERVSQKYFFAWMQICRDTFMFCHAIGKYKLNSIASSLDKDGLKPRVHGNAGKQPKHAMSVLDVKRVGQFLEEYTSKNGLPLPGRHPNHSPQDNRVLLLLPSDKTKSEICDLYNEAARVEGYRQISLSEFKKIWLEQCPNILIMKPATDLCPKCQRYVHNISIAGNLTEEEKKVILEEYTEHIDRAKGQREYYKSKCMQSKDTFSTLDIHQKETGTLTFIFLYGRIFIPVLYILIKYLIT